MVGDDGDGDDDESEDENNDNGASLLLLRRRRGSADVITPLPLAHFSFHTMGHRRRGGYTRVTVERGRHST